jgi:hypothetical protein
MKLCECGCGQPTKLASKTKATRGEFKGQPQRFIHGHAARVIRGTLIERLERRIRVDGSCWIWTGGTSTGYGVVQAHGRSERAHRVLYELLVGQIPAGAHLHHECHKPSCVNPAHLRPVTPSAHTLLHGRNVIRCPAGHDYTEENTYVIPGTSQRQCRLCKRAADRRYRERKRKP